MVQGLENVTLNKTEFCEVGICKGKNAIVKFSTRSDAWGLLDISHIDIAASIMPISHDAKKYFVTFLDVFSRFCVDYMTKCKNEVVQFFRTYQFYAVYSIKILQL